ncbi:polysaccharide biosynthesis protein [Lacisediminihabitans profunda]|uniref:polysaccharide biosynthesis protein n=1 Tax=Lacisediminihabitans profunda TaxID=2594790 RepID=UPI001FEB0247|nr:nucleoside-diphosphate sugar epimerase/dehydratase [Lacisediminihabitans profunda]
MRRGTVPRFVTQYSFDALSWVLALGIGIILRFELDLERVTWLPLVFVCAAAVVLQFVFGWAFYLYRGRHSSGSFGEVVSLLGAVASVTVILGIPILLFGNQVGIPRSTVLIAAPIAFVLTGGVRYVSRVVAERSTQPAEGAEMTLIYGAGHLGASIIRRMQTDQGSAYVPAGIIDDDLHKRHAWVHGVKVMGTRADLHAVARATDATVLVVTIAHADASLLREISDNAAEAGLLVKVLPPLEEVLAGKSRLRDLREISIEDLIGRHPVDTQMESIAGYLKGKKVLVTGAGGSIGSELCRQISKFQPSELIMLDRDETGLQGTQISISGHGLLDTKDVVLADIRDIEALEAIFQARRPDVVFHAAALKHLPMLEQYPDEAWKTNVLGTLNVLNAARAVGVTTFVNISTDKAANPTSVLGHSKRVAEKLTAWAADQTGLGYLSVRFGNVIGSRGSMLPTFTALIEAGGPLTITHPDVTRFFMTIPEACQLVVQAGGIGRPGEVLILDMGEPVRILDVAERMIEMSGKDIAIVYTGLRAGEKLHEVLIGDRESDERPVHPSISHTTIDGIDPTHLDKAGWHARLSGHPTRPLAAASSSRRKAAR